MNTTTATTVIKMLESVPDQLQENIVEHMRDYIENIREETKWNESFSKTQEKLITAARKAKQEINEGIASPMDINKL